MKSLVVLCCIVLLVGCSRDKNPMGASEAEALGFYFFQNDSITIYNVDENQDAALQAEPWLSGTDIEFFDFSSHVIYLKSGISAIFPEYENGFELFRAMPLKPFWVVAEGERCYIGAFHTAASSFSPQFPYFDEMAFHRFPNDVLALNKAWQDPDARDNATVREALIRAGLYHAGIAVNIENIQLVENGETATIGYDLVIHNKDEDDLLIFDHDKCGGSIFNYYTNGPTFWDEDNQRHNRAQRRPVTEVDSWQPQWFTRLNIGETKRWTITLSGYDKFEHGTYNCSFTFTHPAAISREQRVVDNARYWMGQIEAPQVTVTF